MERDLRHGQRRLLSGAFSNSYLNGLEPLVQECIGDFERYLDSECSKVKDGRAVVDVWVTLSNVAFVSRPFAYFRLGHDIANAL